MKAIIYLTTTLFFLFILNGKVFSQIHEYQFRKLDKFVYKDSTSNDVIKVAFTVDSVQQTKKGLTFSLKIKNEGAKSLKLSNPLDYLGLTLLDDQNKNVLVSQGSRFKNRNKDLFSYSAFHIEKVKQNNILVSLDLNKIENIQINSKDNLEIFLVIKNIRDRNNKYLTDIPIPAGIYSLTGTFSIVNELKHDVMILNPISIHIKNK